MRTHPLCILICVILTNCGGKLEKKNETGEMLTFTGQEFITVEGLLTQNQSKLAGNGSILANTPLPSISSGSHFQIHANLQQSASISLVVNSNSKLEQGLIIKFSNNSGVLNSSIRSGDILLDLSDKFTNQSSTSISYGIDVHNDETPSHVLIWQLNAANTDKENAIYNSEEGATAPGNGLGSFWGIISNNATISSATVGGPKFEE